MNIDEYLDLQDPTEINLLSTEHTASIQPEEQEVEWHSATPTLDSSNNTTSFDNWGSLLQQNGFDNLEGIDLTALLAASGSGGATTAADATAADATAATTTGIDPASVAALAFNHFITPGSLMKQPPPPLPTPLIIPEVEVQPQPQRQKRVTRSRSKPLPPALKRKKTTRAKKLYCTCQQPYNGEPMVQCDTCEEWFHCSCVEFNPDHQEEDEGNVDWVCGSCKQVPNEPEIKTVVKEEKPAYTRQTRTKSQSKCLYTGCNNHTRKDSFCSDVCARRQNESEAPTSLRGTRRTSSMRTSAQSMALSKEKKISIEAEEKEPVLQQEEDDDSDVDEQEEFQAEEDDDDEEEIPQSATPDTPNTPNTPNTPMSPSQMTEEENPVRRNVIKNMKAVLKTIFDVALAENADMMDESTLATEERAEILAKSIENTMLEQLGDGGMGKKRRTCGETYKSKFRSLLYNLKDKANKVFQIRVITGDLTPDELVKMSSEDMANPELKSMSEVFRKTGLKNSVMKIDNTPIIKKTHKGDIIMVPDKDNNNMYSEQVQQQLDKIKSPLSFSSHTTTTMTTAAAATATISSLSPTTSSKHQLDPLDDILARIGIPAQDDNSHISSSKRSGSMSDATLDTVDPEVKKRRVALEVEELLGAEDETFQVEEVDITELDNNKKDEDDEKEDALPPPPPPQKEAEILPTIWQGRVNMPQVAEFEASARQIGGRVLSETEWGQVLSPTMWIEGRIPSERVTDYITQTQYSVSREIVLLEIEAKGGNANTQGQTLLHYLDSRQRYAVVGHNKTRIKDFYLVPLYKVQHIPDCLYVVRVEETKRQCDLFLGVLVLSKLHSEQKPVAPLPPPSNEQPSYQHGYNPTSSSYGGYNNNSSSTSHNAPRSSSNQQYDNYSSSSYYRPSY